ncbi:upstream activation factor subunit spp27-like [Diospyros lotus]|uniref:upstream activation factor subunit spp27-like n=1 Tax=Diospyros lotus TaxID=55363 RepID=UPI00224EAA3C|nr:upstream activation factor subunit spp27-like [Diospyros lotus]
MAIPLGVCPSTFFAGETASLAKPSSLSSLRFRFQSLPPPSQVSLRAVSVVTTATASKPATDTRKREPRGITKPRRVSPEMQAFLGGISEIPRTQALKEIWAHIKQHNLQDPQNKKIIVCDEKLKSIFGGRERVGFLEIAGLISPHFLK